MNVETSPLEELESLLEEGKITQEEFEKLRKALEASKPGKLIPEDTTDRRGLMKSWRNRQLEGVCGGIAKLLKVNPWLVRIVAVFALLTALPLTLVGYFVLGVVLPWDDPDAAQESQRKGRPGLFLGVMILLAGLSFFNAKCILPTMIDTWESMNVQLSPPMLFVVQANRLLFLNLAGLFLVCLLTVILFLVYLVIHNRVLRRAYAVSVVAVFAGWLFLSFCGRVLPFF